MRKLGMAAVVFASSMVGFSAMSHAGPPFAWSSDDVSYPRGVCMQKAGAALSIEGYTNVRASGAFGTAAEKGPLTGVILCLNGIKVVFVTGGQSGVNEPERSHLQYHMTRE
jgi:hypothetical protein